MTAPASLTSADRFVLHPAARVFAGPDAIKADARATGIIAPAPAGPALGALMGAVARGARFCVTDHALPDLAGLLPGQFATLTGGSTGAPKVIARTQASWIASFAVTAGRFGPGPGRGVAILGDLTHSLALYGAVEALHLGATLHALGGLSARAQGARLAQTSTHLLYATPTQLRLLAAACPPGSLPDLGVILCGGGALDPVTRAALHRLCPHSALHVFYGAAETSFVTLSDATTPEGSVGRAYPGVEIALSDEEIRVRSPYLFDRYLQGHSMHTRWHDGWLSLGERGHLDADGNLFLRGRAGRMITVADRNVFLDEVMAHLAPLAHPRHIAVVARADRLRGRRLALMLSGKTDTNLSGTLSNACRDSFGTAPGAVRFVDPFPLLASGKPDLHALEAMA